MPRISLLIADEDLAIIDAAANPNRTAFMVAAAKEVAQRVQRVRDDAEVARICQEHADEDRALAAEFASTLPDGLKDQP
jgi:uncharacterized protein (DUF1778 family)